MIKAEGHACLGIECLRKLRCYRYVASRDYYDGFYEEAPNKKGVCKEYVEIPLSYIYQKEEEMA